MGSGLRKSRKKAMRCIECPTYENSRRKLRLLFSVSRHSWSGSGGYIQKAIGSFFLMIFLTSRPPYFGGFFIGTMQPKGGKNIMKKIALTTYMAIAVLFCAQNAFAWTIGNSSTCYFDNLTYSYSGSISNSVVSQCTSKRYGTLTNRSTGATYGVWQECTECSSGYYLSDSMSGMAHDTCGKISFYATCLAKKTCSVSSSSAAASTVTGCASAVKLTFGSSTVYSCTTCNSGYTRTSETVSDQQCTNTTTRYYCKAATCTAATVSTYTTPTMTGCKTQYKKVFGGVTYDTCGACKTGYYLDNPDATTISSTQCSNTVKSIGCTGSCTGTDGWSCPSGTINWCTWRHRTVVNGQCQGEDYFTCAEGYYGKAPGGCKKCPENPNGSTPSALPGYGDYPWIIKSNGGNAIDDTKITDCAVQSGQDASGTYVYVVYSAGSGTEFPYRCKYSE